jgi:hypothetical protein
MDQALRDRLTTLTADDRQYVATELIETPLSLAERLAVGSADDVEAALRRICEWHGRDQAALLAAVDLCAAVREHLRDSRSGERKGLAKVDHALIAVEKEQAGSGRHS